MLVPPLMTLPRDGVTLSSAPLMSTVAVGTVTSTVIEMLLMPLLLILPATLVWRTCSAPGT